MFSGLSLFRPVRAPGRALNAGILPHDVPVFPPGTGIPRVIHQAFYPRASLPEPIRAQIEQLKAMNPGWEHRLYDDADMERYIAAHYGPQILRAYRRINPRYAAARVDLFRYLVIYREGGVYLDVKSTALRPLDEIIRPDDRYLLCGWANRPGEAFEGIGLHAELAMQEHGEFQQWHVIAAPGAPGLRSVINAVLTNLEAYRPWRDRVGRMGVLRVTGPIPYTLGILAELDRQPHRFERTNDAFGLVYSGLPVYHADLYRRHYSDQTSSVVRLEHPVDRIRGGLHWLRKEWNYRVRRVRRSIRTALHRERP